MRKWWATRNPREQDLLRGLAAFLMTVVFYWSVYYFCSR